MPPSALLPVMNWFVLNHISPAICRSRSAAAEIDSYNRLHGCRLDLFAPTFVKMTLRSGRWQRTDSPLLFHYVFIRGTEADIKQLAAADNGFSLIIDKAAATRRYLTVPPADMHAFRIIAARCGNELPCFAPDEVDLTEGDLVEIATGPFAGIRGTYIARKGASSGAVCIAPAGIPASLALDVSADYLRIIRYASGSKRPYDHIDSFLPRLRRAEDAAAQGHALTPELTAPIQTFIRRMGATQIDAPRLRAKLDALLRRADALMSQAL